MPQALLQPCNWPGCPGLRHRSKRYCDRHAVQVEAGRKKSREMAKQARAEKTTPRKPDTRPGPRQRGYSPRWDRFSQYMRRKYPVCQCCDRAFSKVVDHIVPKSQGGQDIEIACWCLCEKCHNRKTAKYDGGGGRRVSNIYCGRHPHDPAHMAELKRLIREGLQP